METFSALLALYAGNSPVPVNSPHKGQWRGALMFSLICTRINDWVNNREAGDLRRHRGHYDVIVMYLSYVVSHIHQVSRSIVAAQPVKYERGMSQATRNFIMLLTKRGPIECLHSYLSKQWSIKDGWRFADDIFKRIILNESYDILIQISPHLISRGQLTINNHRFR